jgi:hypothetical protein
VNGVAPSFGNLSSLQAFTSQKKIIVNVEQPHLFDFNKIIYWITDRNSPFECSDFLNAWNAFSDIAASCPQIQTDFRKLHREKKAIYDKLFWGCNLPAVTPEGERFEPEWNPRETESIASIMTSGLDLFVSCIYAHN